MASETDGAAPSVSQSPSFKGQLKINEFMFREQNNNTTIRRSARLLSSQPSSAGGSPTPAKSNGKRKAVGGDGGPEPEGATPTPAPASSSASSRSSKKRKAGAAAAGGGGAGGYAPPSTYAHLPQVLPDALGPGLIVLFVGLNPGVETARTGHAYAHPTNLFWRLLDSSGVTPRLCQPREDGDMPRLFSLGLTNIVGRPSRNGGELRSSELDDGVAALEGKARWWRPEAVCIVGKSIWESIWRVRHGRKIRPAEFRYGWQDEGENMGVVGRRRAGEDEGEVADGVVAREDWKGARVFVATSTSGLAATLPLAEKQRIWRELGVWVEERRERKKEKAVVASPVGGEDP